MNFLDLKQMEIKELTDGEYVTLHFTLNANNILDATIKEANIIINNTFKVNYHNKNVYVDVLIADLTAENEDAKLDNFTCIADLLVSTLLQKNLSSTVREDKEKDKVMNRLPSGAWILSSKLIKQINCSISMLTKCGSFKPNNKSLNITIHTENNDFLYSLITKE